jgi:hypothetical protein
MEEMTTLMLAYCPHCGERFEKKKIGEKSSHVCSSGESVANKAPDTVSTS